MTPSPVFLPVRELAGLVRTRQVSPVALAETVLERLTTLGPRYNAVVTVMRERALDAARRAEREIAAGLYRGTACRRPGAPRPFAPRPSTGTPP